MQIHKRTIGRKYKLKPNLFSFCFSLCPHTTDLLVELLSCLLRSALPFHHLRPSLEIQGYVSAYYPNKANSMQNINLLVATIIQEKLPNFQLFCLPLEVLNRLLKFRISSIFVMPQNKITTPKKKKLRNLFSILFKTKISLVASKYLLASPLIFLENSLKTLNRRLLEYPFPDSTFSLTFEP